MKTEIDVLTKEISDLGARKAALQTPLRVNMERLNSLRETQRTTTGAVTRDAAIHELMRCKNNGTIPGIYGRLGDLGGIAKQYEIAISAVAGTNLDRVVVDSVETSKLCLEQASAAILILNNSFILKLFFLYIYVYLVTGAAIRPRQG